MGHGEHISWCRRGLELPLIESRLIAYDTGERIQTPAALLEAIERVSPRSLFFHVHDARWRTGGQTDDFSSWLEQFGAEPSLVAKLRGIDFYFLNLSQLRQALVDAFRRPFGWGNAAGSYRPWPCRHGTNGANHETSTATKTSWDIRRSNACGGWLTAWPASVSYTSIPPRAAAAWRKSWAG